MKPHCISLLSILLLAEPLCAQREMQEFDIDTVPIKKHALTIDPLQSLIGTVGLGYSFSPSYRTTVGLSFGIPYRTTFTSSFDPVYRSIASCLGVNAESSYGRFFKKDKQMGIGIGLRYKHLILEDKLRTYHSDASSTTSYFFPYEDSVCVSCRTIENEIRRVFTLKVYYISRTKITSRLFADFQAGLGYRLAWFENEILSSTGTLNISYGDQPRYIFDLFHHYPTIHFKINLGWRW